MGKTQQPVPNVTPLERQMPNVDIQALVQQQGVQPFQGFEKIDALWTPQFNFDGFDAWYEQQKAERRTKPPKRRP